MSEFNGHKSWNAWNVSLWINNDVALYNTAFNLAQQYGIDKAARIMTQELQGHRTPDGGKYNYTTIKSAMRGMTQ